MKILNRSPQSTKKQTNKKTQPPTHPILCQMASITHLVSLKAESHFSSLEILWNNPITKDPPEIEIKYTKRTFCDMWLMARMKGHCGLHNSQYTIIIQAACILLNYYRRVGVYRSIFRVVNNLTEFVKRSEEASSAECIPWWCPSTESTSGRNICQRPFHILWAYGRPKVLKWHWHHSTWEAYFFYWMLRSVALRDQESNKEHKKKMDIDAQKHGVAYCLFRPQIYSAHKKNGNLHSKSSKVEGKFSK